MRRSKWNRGAFVGGEAFYFASNCFIISNLKFGATLKPDSKCCKFCSHYVQVAAKFEKKDHISPQLRHEYKVYRELKGSRGICSVSPRTFLTVLLHNKNAVTEHADVICVIIHEYSVL